MNKAENNVMRERCGVINDRERDSKRMCNGILTKKIYE